MNLEVLWLKLCPRVLSELIVGTVYHLQKADKRGHARISNAEFVFNRSSFSQLWDNHPWRFQLNWGLKDEIEL